MRRIAVAVVVGLVAGTWLVTGLPGAADAQSACPRGLQQRTPEQVLEDHRSALASGDFDRAMCNFAEGASVIHDGGIDVITTFCIDIPDGADTYLIRNGLIEAQTAHGFPVFKCGF